MKHEDAHVVRHSNYTSVTACSSSWKNTIFIVFQYVFVSLLYVLYLFVSFCIFLYLFISFYMYLTSSITAIFVVLSFICFYMFFLHMYKHLI